MREWLFELRKANNLTLKEAGEKLGISESYYKMIEAGQRQQNMDMVLIQKISAAFEIPITKIFSLEMKQEGV